MSVPPTVPNLTRVREAFVYSIRRRALRFAQLDGQTPDAARRCLQLALARFLPESRSLPPPQWTTRWWALLVGCLPDSAEQEVFALDVSAAWQLAWERLPLIQRRSFLLHVWLRLPPGDAAAAQGVDERESARLLAMASLQLRRAMEAESDAELTLWLERLRDGLEHAQLALPAPVSTPIALPRSAARPILRLLFAAAGLALLLAGGLLLRPTHEPLPVDIVVPEGASGLPRSDATPALLPDDAARLVDPDWPLWAEPAAADVISELEFYAWLEAGGER